MKNIFFILIILNFQLATSQSWQWAKRGGSGDNLPTTGGNRIEEVYSMVTDSQKNVYVLSNVGEMDLNVDSNVKQYWGDSTTKTDVMLASFACDGSYRWSKVIGGANIDGVLPLQIDAQDNIYFAGAQPGADVLPSRIDNDIIIPQLPTPDYSAIFIAKYSSGGVLQWYKRPVASTTDFNVGYGVYPMGLVTDAAGNSSWLLGLRPGTYFNNQYNTTQSSTYTYHILKLNSSGTFLGGTPIEITTGVNNSGGIRNVKLYHNAINGNLFVMGNNAYSPGVTLQFGGQPINNSHFLACFNAAGTFLWKRESNTTQTGWCYPYGLAFDQDNNIYVGGNFVQNPAITNSYLGYVMQIFQTRQFIIKLNPDASQVLWSTNSNAGGLDSGGIAYNPLTNQVGLTTWGGGDYTWGNLTVNVNTFGVSGDAVLLRFNKNTGVCTNIDKIAGNPNFADNGTALAVDASGDYIVGGAFGGSLFPNATTTLTSVGGQSDFFVAKFATQPCSPLANVGFQKTNLQVYPNPTTGLVTVSVSETTSFEVVDVLGKVLQKGVLTVQDNVLDLSGFGKGVYFLRVSPLTPEGETDVISTKKIILE